MGMRRSDLLLLAVAVVWGSSYLAAQTLVLAGGVLAVLALRFLVSALALSPAMAGRRPGWAQLRVGALLGLTQASVLVLETFGVSLTSATNAGVLISLTILLTPVLEGAVHRRWLPGRFFVAAAVAVGGVVLLVAGPGLRAPTAGDALMLAAAVVRATHVTLSGRLTGGRQYDTVTLTWLQTAVGAALFTALAAPDLPAAVRAFGPGHWLGVLYLALGCSVFAFLVQLWAIRRTSAARASLLLGTEPVWAVLIGVGIAGERLSAAAVAGIVLVLAGTWAGQRIEAAHRERHPGSVREDPGGPAGDTGAEVPRPGGRKPGASTDRRRQPVDSGTRASPRIEEMASAAPGRAKR
ncbi:DMT family transporter [Dactylosporangium matsuzakiense]|uniref:Membrane protein n=1 Tax=Dactylosporangium matsuzakiense TaxID=53360 RepID=A0A9W6KL77_9ACTN|nr:DMT family transporter [Dactylosporangium matsuzakiense]UWZ41598.1 DMT family transporter [Dactylosporangium matsuzakiense]GLL02331.1 membrane protein [Dactylosporangium matsuzakiense]